LWTKNVTTLLALVVMAFAAAGCVGDEQANEDNTEDQATTDGPDGEKDLGQNATLELQGEPGTEFQGSCAVADDEPDEISGQLPESFTYNLEGRRLDCEIISASDVRVDLTVGKNVRSVQQISGGTLNLTYENGGISSNVSSSSGSSGQGSSSSSETITKESSATTNKPGNVASEPRDVSDFDEVELKGIGNLSIEQTGSESLTVEAEEEVLPKIRTEVDNNRLIIEPKPNTSISTSEPINYKLTVKDLNALKVSGSGTVDAESMDTDELAVGISGSGDVKIGGKAGSQDIKISGSGSYRAEDLESKEAKIEVGGSGSAIVNVSEELEAEVSGSGSVEYVGNPTVNQDVSGAGEVRKH
jgi:hypothetical protein